MSEASKPYTAAAFSQILTIDRLGLQEQRINQLEGEKAELTRTLFSKVETIAKMNAELSRLKEGTFWRKAIEFCVAIVVASATFGLRFFSDGAGYAVSVAFLFAASAVGALLIFKK